MYIALVPSNFVNVEQELGGATLQGKGKSTVHKKCRILKFLLGCSHSLSK